MMYEAPSMMYEAPSMMYEAPSMMYAYSCLDSVLCGSLHAGIVLALWNLTLFDPDFGLFYFIHFSHFILFYFLSFWEYLCVLGRPGSLFVVVGS
jgi:hypothetical protein